ncbi:MAG: type IX secretion system membrane protein PorP/SprF [Proteiniphilum sp.]|uniref:PorP/SprF family type IX secretion system membrane protein n=1 Tax=Proteiniphilum sp. TaxID=1926877 RepID=UPI002B1F41A3|nr:type IX secretion system membrane protein PorP/SprF [Proteiniphilum sp.]MEA5129953.1 type IX secretion system membrane protein PorP/SprF [Proteiniphilum sp.]
MEKRRFSFIILLLLWSLAHLQAQWDDLPGQYWATKVHFNPSFAGETEAISTAALYRYRWTGIENAPRQFYLMADMPFEFFGKRHGAGLMIYNETVGQLHNSLLAAQYNFKKEIGRGFLNMGLQVGVYDLHFDAGSKHITEDSLQHKRGILRVNPTGKQVIDLGAGISWTGKAFFAGLSVMHLNQPGFYAHNDSLSTDIQSDSARSSISRSYNLIVGCNISLFHPLEIQPMMWIQTYPKQTEVEATVRLEYDKKFSGGLSWRRNDGYLLFAGAVIHDIELGYAYGIHTSGPGKNSRGSHELFLRYNFPIDYFKPKRQPHKSIRLL